jgi:hypothetical protein
MNTDNASISQLTYSDKAVLRNWAGRRQRAAQSRRIAALIGVPSTDRPTLCSAWRLDALHDAPTVTQHFTWRFASWPAALSGVPLGHPAFNGNGRAYSTYKSKFRWLTEARDLNSGQISEKQHPPAK